jgi:hypothetical protein
MEISPAQRKRTVTKSQAWAFAAPALTLRHSERVHTTATVPASLAIKIFYRVKVRGLAICGQTSVAFKVMEQVSQKEGLLYLLQACI